MAEDDNDGPAAPGFFILTHPLAAGGRVLPAGVLLRLTPEAAGQARFAGALRPASAEDQSIAAATLVDGADLGEPT